MNLIEQNIQGCMLIENTIFSDQRGAFFEVMNQELLQTLDILKIDQVNISKSKHGVFRGFHYQVKERLTQFVTCIKGEVLDFAVDMRKDSPTFGNVVAANLSQENHNTLYLPSGLAHGFLNISKEFAALFSTVIFLLRPGRARSFGRRAAPRGRLSEDGEAVGLGHG